MKKIFFIIVASLSFIPTFAASPTIGCEGLPGCTGTTGSQGNIVKETKFISTFISQFIQYIAVIAVIYLMIAGLMYLLSGGDDEKVKKAKKAIVWALVGVFVSISAWAIIGVVNTFKIP